MTEQIPHEVQVVPVESLKPGSIVAIRVGITSEELGGGPPWIPTQEELTQVGELWKGIVPEGVHVYVDHIGFEVGVLSND